jgi:tetratricopeptide (TPR) repeat protein
VELRGAGYSSDMSFFWVGYAMTLMRLDRIDEAEAIFETVIRENPKETLNHVGLGIVFFSQGRVSECFRKVDDAIAADPGSRILYMLRGGKCAFEANNCEEARADVERALELPPHPLALEFEVRIRISCRSCPGLYDPARAVEAARLAVRFAPLSSEAHRTLGAALLENGDHAAARDAVQRSIDMHYLPGAEDLFLMAMIDWNLGDRASARTYYERAVARREATFPDHPTALLLQEDARGVLGLSN